MRTKYSLDQNGTCLHPLYNSLRFDKVSTQETISLARSLCARGLARISAHGMTAGTCSRCLILTTADLLVEDVISYFSYFRLIKQYLATLTPGLRT